MKCEIIKDLLPSYIDGLTSQESNIEIEAHLKTCVDCADYFQEMGKDVNDTNMKSIRSDIDPFIKIRQGTLRKIVLAVFITAAIVGVSIEAYHNYWTYGTSIYSTEMTLSCQKQGDVTQLVFEPTGERTRLSVGYVENKEIDGIMPRATLHVAKHNEKNSEDERIVNDYYDMIFLDENTFIDLEAFPKISEISKEDVFAIEYNEKTVLINISDLYHGKITIE